MVDIPADSSTTATIEVGGSVVGTVDTTGDRDWFRVTLTAGQTYKFELQGTGTESLQPSLRICGFGGDVLLAQDSSDFWHAALIFTAPVSGTYFLDAGTWTYSDEYSESSPTGDYVLSAQSFTPTGLGTVDQFVTQLVSGYWANVYGVGPRHFNVTQGGTLTFNIEGLNAAGQALALAALEQWSDIIGVTFQRVTTSAKIMFDDDDPEMKAYATGVTGPDKIITSATVHISSSWLDFYGATIGGWSYQTYLHEIGHALGLGHAGNYNDKEVFLNGVLYSNDAWPMSVMSYYNQYENAYFADRGFSMGNTLTPMIADIAAMQKIYGLSSNTRSGDTSYGSFGEGVFNVAERPWGVFTIFDSGGRDVIDLSTFSNTQVIDLNPEAFSNVGWGVGNMVIARGVMIEDAIGGSGNDALFGNAAGNRLQGGAGKDALIGNDGDDYLDGGAGADTLNGGAGNDRIVYDAADNPANVTGGIGTDTLVVIDQAAPTSYNLAAGSFEAAEVTLHDTANAMSWSSIVTNYNASWQALNQNMVNDDGSHSFTAFDWNNAQGWDQVWFTYNAAGQQVSEDYRYDDGKRSWVAIDAANAQNWSQVWFTYDTSGNKISEDYRYDDGKRSWVSIDAANASSWAQVWFTYDVAGNKVSEDYRYDDNGRSWVAFDADGSKVWNNIWFTFDANGHQASEDRTNDDGTRVWTAYDANSSQSWSQSAFYYDAGGHLYQQVTTWDDGSTSTTVF